ncbi:hypothetical protein [Marinomonas transparens]|uniref:Uncharacterized protein n=1 Tax=Marinomonas transparens TaxID=2795388 RepID=A0A934JIQ9_9GAMM|nr:hypothetical protein [Marinomonas transparens]MBJ7536536.1 hypothetical protein [Marinomonas transparens]
MRVTPIQDGEVSGIFSTEYNYYGEQGYLVGDFPKDNAIKICDLIIHKKQTP